MAKTYFKATFPDGRQVIRSSSDDYGFTHAFTTYAGTSFTAKPHTIPAKYAGDVATVEKVDGATARRMLKDGTAKPSGGRA